MSAARDRAALAAIGCDILALEGDAGARRARALLDQVAERERPQPTLDELAATPAWLRQGRDRQRRVAIAAALLSMGPALGTAIDGAWLGRLAATAGEPLLDWAMTASADLPALGEPLEPAELAPWGFGLLRAALPEAMLGYLDWAPWMAAGNIASADVDRLLSRAAGAP
jgi:hypothetical protein